MFLTGFIQFQGSHVYRTSTLILKEPRYKLESSGHARGGRGQGTGGQKLANGLSFPLWTMETIFLKTSRFQASSDFSWLASAPFQHPSPSPMYMCSFVVLVSCLLAHYYLLLCNQNQARMFRVFTVRHERQTCSCVKGELSMYVYTNKMQSCIPRAGQLDISIYMCVY